MNTLTKRFMEELGVLLQAFNEFADEKEQLEVLIQKNDLSVKNVRGEIADILGVLETDLETQEFILKNQKSMINRSELNKNEQRRQIQEIQDQLESVREGLDVIQRVKKGERL